MNQNMFRLTAQSLPKRSVLATSLIMSGLTVIGCASMPETPSAIKPPAGQVLAFDALASGVQIYECKAKSETQYEWTFISPEAPLTDKSGALIGKHYGGPTWEAKDGSTVVGEVKAREAAPSPSAIPWLLLSAKSNTGTGLFSNIKSIQRVDTTGGVAPAQPCGAANGKTLVRVPYTAKYLYFR